MTAHEAQPISSLQTMLPWPRAYGNGPEWSTGRDTPTVILNYVHLHCELEMITADTCCHSS
jgi:hypothetical protein